MTADPETTLFGRLRLRLALVIAVVIAAILLVLDGGVLFLMDQVLVSQQADAVRTSVLASRDELRVDATGVRVRTDPDEGATLFLVWGPAGDLLFSSQPVNGAEFGPPATSAQAAAPDTPQLSVVGTGGAAYQVASMPVRSFAFAGVIQAARSLQPIRDAEGRITVLLVAAAGAGVVLAALAGWFLAGRSLRPVRAAFRRQREFTADASHELRTPLAVIDAGVQVLSRHPDRPVSAQADTLAAISGQTARMKRLVSDLLTLAVADAGQASLSLGEVDLDELVRSTVRSFEPLAVGRSAEVTAGRLDGGMIRADGDRLGQALAALVHNAIEHGGSGIQVVLSVWREGRLAILEVRDDGPGIPANEQARVLERFVRGDPARSGDGSGLGLAVARWVAEAHGGRLTLGTASADAETPGLRARFELPIA
jgi:two-component system, OmpR family, sensor histidine kinase CiaH